MPDTLYYLLRQTRAVIVPAHGTPRSAASVRSPARTCHSTHAGRCARLRGCVKENAPGSELTQDCPLRSAQPPPDRARDLSACQCKLGPPVPCGPRDQFRPPSPPGAGRLPAHSPPNPTGFGEAVLITGFNDGSVTTQTVRDPLGRGPVRTH